MTKFFLYARKSTDEPDRQILSIEAQIAELKEFAQKEQLNIVQTFIESQTAKEPGRPIFNDMLSQIEKGKAEGILAWHPDRLARNSVDGGKIIWLLDTGKIQSLKFPTFWFESTPQGKFMLNIAFGQNKYYIDNLSENVKRGLRQKVRRGEYPGVAPTGYLNNRLTKKMVPDPERFRLVQKIFKLYSTGNYSLKEVRSIITEAGLRISGAISVEEYAGKKQKILNQKIEISEKLKVFQQKGYSWLEPAKNFILASNEAKNAASSSDLAEKAQFLKKVGSNLVLADQNVKYFPRGAWKILGNLPPVGAEPRSGEAENGTEKREYSTVLGCQDANLNCSHDRSGTWFLRGILAILGASQRRVSVRKFGQGIFA